METSNVFTIMPMSQDFSLVPGETYTGEIMIVNPADAVEDFRYKMSVTPYGVTGNDYQADLATRSEQTKIMDWITIEEPTGVLKPNETRKVQYTITVPADAAGGGQYAAIAVGADLDTDDGAVAVKNIFEMACIIYGSVEGEIKHEGEILENSVPGFATTMPVSSNAVITNTGNVHELATIVIEATNFFTGEVILPTDENEGRYAEVIMPETERFITRELDNLPVLGVVKLKQTIYYNGQTSETERDIIICPIWFMTLIAVTIAAIIGVIILIVRKHKKRSMV